MIAVPQRQEVLNVLLAQLLQERGLVAVPEAMIRSAAEGRKMPDVIVSFNGLRLAIEGEVADQPDAKEHALTSARRRVEQGIAYIGVAVVYPAHLRSDDFAVLKAHIAKSRMLIAVVTEAEETGFTSGGVNYLERTLRRAFEQLVKEDVVERAVAILDAAVEKFAAGLSPQAGNVGRAAQALDIRELPGRADVQRGAISRISGLTLINAMIFQEILSEHDSRVRSLAEIFGKDTLTLRELHEHWQAILKIDYFPIFHIAGEILESFSASQSDNLRRLFGAAQEIVKMRASLRHDLMGRVYHRLLSEAKYLGTYYTSIPAATLLLRLALNPAGWPVEWRDLDQVRQFRIADLACGTGTLLMAAAETMTDNYVSAAAQRGQAVDLDALHQALTEAVLHGYDVLSSALHLTASTLALRSPTVSFTNMNLFKMPLGGPEHRLGSLEFLNGKQVQLNLDLFGAAAQQVTHNGMAELPLAPLPPLDLCVMNPPFTRSVGGNLLFGSAPEDERKVMQKKLQQLIQRHATPANVTAGLGSVFSAAADPYIKPGGRLALVLPKALLSGVAWKPTRDLLAQNYQVEYIVASHDPQRWNFSDSTDLSEVLLVARKNGSPSPLRLRSGQARPSPQRGEGGSPAGRGRGDGGDGEGELVVAVNLSHNPRNSLEALAVADQLENDTPVDLMKSNGALRLFLGENQVGGAIAVPWDDFKSRSTWLLPCAFAQPDALRVVYHLLSGEIWVPGRRGVKRIKLCSLDKLGTLGPDRRDIHDGFDLSQRVTRYPAFWGHDAQAVYTLAQDPNIHLSPLRDAKPGRSLRDPDDLWPLAGKVLIGERLWLKTQRLVALRFTKPVLSNVWWPFTFDRQFKSVQYEKALAVWLNSTLGLYVMFAYREETRGAWVDFKKPVLLGMPVLNLEAITPIQLKKLAAAYDHLCSETLLPFPEMATDPVRAKIDSAIAQTLNLPDLAVLREMLAREPVVCLQKL